MASLHKPPVIVMVTCQGCKKQHEVTITYDQALRFFSKMDILSPQEPAASILKGLDKTHLTLMDSHLCPKCCKRLLSLIRPRGG